MKCRWRQVLSEAERINTKHLITLEPGISENQTEEMRTKRLQLVVPEPVHASYRKGQQGWLMGLAGFVEMVRNRGGTLPINCLGNRSSI